MKGIPPTFAPAVGESGKDALGGVLPCNSPFPRVQIANVVQPQPGSRFFPDISPSFMTTTKSQNQMIWLGSWEPTIMVLFRFRRRNCSHSARWLPKSRPLVGSSNSSAGKRLDHRAFAGPVGAEQRAQAAAVDFQVGVADDRPPPVGNGQIPNFQSRHFSNSPSQHAGEWRRSRQTTWRPPAPPPPPASSKGRRPIQVRERRACHSERGKCPSF